jgi:hypothetical protein
VIGGDLLGRNVLGYWDLMQDFSFWRLASCFWRKNDLFVSKGKLSVFKNLISNHYQSLP